MRDENRFRQLRTLAPLVVTIGVLGSGSAHAQDFPSKPLRILAGERGGGDFGARQLANGLTGYLAQPVIVENRGIIGAEMLAKAPPDGYTLLFYGSTAWISPLLRSVNWDPIKERFKNDDAANAMLSRPQRAPYVID